MSLVNDMLRDLDKRRRLPPQAARVNHMMEKHQPNPRVASPWIAGAVSLSVLLGLAAGYLMFRPASEPAAVTSAPAMEDSGSNLDGSAVPAQAANVAVAVSNTMNIVQEQGNELGFLLRIKAAQPVRYNIVSRDTYGITLHLEGIDNYSKDAADLTGMSVLLESGGANVEIDLDAATDFKVFEDSNTAEFDIVLQASFRQATLPVAAATNASEPSAALPPLAQPAPQMPAPAVPLPAIAAQLPQLAAANRDVPVRVTRELTPEQRDANASRSAIALMQGGQLLEAYRELLAFIDANAGAHQSRATLATLLLAQQDLPQAQAVVEAGLDTAPNFAPYKKIKARIMMQQGDDSGALALLREVAPIVTEDPEYHEILAALYQQNSQHPQAVSTYQGLLRHDSKQGRWWMGMAISLEAQGSTQDALNSFRAALQNGNLDSGLREYSQSRIRSLGGGAQ
jgi:tetratricopeptide (TPR) repeat protein